MKYSTHYKRTCSKTKTKVNKKFITWIDRIEKSVNNTLKLDLLDLPDEPFMIMFEEGVKTKKVVEMMVQDYQELELLI